MVTNGWVMHFETNLAGPLVLMYFLRITLLGSFDVMNSIIVDLNLDKPATSHPCY
jgi:hypothetical protein